MLLDANTSLQLPSQAWCPKLASLSTLHLARWGSVRVDVTACVYWLLSTECICLTSKRQRLDWAADRIYVLLSPWKSMVEFEFWGQGWCFVLLWQPDWLFQSCRKIKSSVWKGTSQAPAWWKCFLKNWSNYPSQIMVINRKQVFMFLTTPLSMCDTSRSIFFLMVTWKQIAYLKPYQGKN